MVARRAHVRTQRTAAETVAALQLMGHDVRAGGQQGTAHSIFVDIKSGQRIGAADPRDKDAGAVGY